MEEVLTGLFGPITIERKINHKDTIVTILYSFFYSVFAFEHRLIIPV